MPRFMRLFWSVVAFMCLGLLLACGQNNNTSAELTDEEKSMPEAKYYSTDFTPFPDEVLDAVAKGPVAPEKTLAFENINLLTNPGYLETENGYALLADGTAYVAVRTDLPGVTKEMLHWWFWWHALKDVRYKIWCPGAHYAIGVEDIARLSDESLSDDERFLNNPQYPVEDIGSGAMNLSIEFVAPETFGFDTQALQKEGIEAVICGIVGFRYGGQTIEHTYMCHLFRKSGNGLELRSRFWLGKKLDMPKIRKMVITEDLAINMLMHCSQEFNHLAGFLPQIYNEFGGQVQ